MKRILKVIILFALMSCDKSADSLEDKSEIQILSKEEQLFAIGQSLPSMESVIHEIKGYISNDTKAQQEYKIEECINSLEEHIKKLKDYIDSANVEDWLDFSYKTFDLYNQTLDIMATLQVELEKLEESEGNATKSYKNTYELIKTCVALVELWVSEVFDGYFDMAIINAQFNDLKNIIKSNNPEVLSEIDKINTELLQYINHILEVYRNTIKISISTNDGFLNNELIEQISELHDNITEDISLIHNRIDSIEDRVAQLEETVKDLMNRIQSLKYIPTHDDGKARVEFPNDDTSDATMHLDFLITPKELTKVLLTTYNEVADIKVAYGGQTEFIEMPIVDCSINSEEGIFSIDVACDELSMAFYRGEIQARALLSLSDGNNDCLSDFITIIPKYTSKRAMCRVEYSTTDNQKIVSHYMPPIQSHTYQDGRGEIIFSQPLVALPDHCFAGCGNLLTMKLPEGLEVIGPCALAWCPSLHIIELPESVNRIENDAFCDCSSLSSNLVLPDNIVYIGSRAFAHCSSLETVKLPNNLTETGENPFICCFNLSEFQGTNISHDGRCLIIGGELISFASSGLFSYAIPEDVKIIGVDCFEQMTDIESIVLSEGIFQIKEGAFGQCMSLRDINFPDSLRSIGEYAFSECESLLSIKLHNQIEYIGPLAFQCCNSIQEFIIPEALNSIEDGTFASCLALSNVHIHENVKSIGEGAFSNCLSLSSITIPQNVTSIGYSAFGNCPLQSVYCKPLTPPAAGGDMFEYYAPIIYVPYESLESYKVAAKWRKYSDCFIGYDFENDKVVE